MVLILSMLEVLDGLAKGVTVVFLAD
jgi:hypothetical protein